jgi:UDP-N-acetylglucosamine/UDP-N-acetylgalactosamine diphosphorylase
MYDIGLPSGRSLFAIQAARLLKLQELANTHAMRDDATVYWYIMTSPAVDTETRAAFVAADYFGLKPEQVFFFCQGMLPCMTDGGKIMLESASSVAMAPNGNGGLYEGLAAAEPTRGMSALQHMEQHGVEFVPQYCVDNALVKIADPIFVGFCVDTQAECAAKVIPKAHAHEKVGVIMKRDGKVGVVEYSEIDAATAEQTNEDGSLTYSACHLCINYFTRAFFVQAAESLVEKMPLHVAHKKIPYYDPATKSVVTPDKSNGIKMELFIFDTFPFTERFSALEVTRAEEFAPVCRPVANSSGTRG